MSTSSADLPALRDALGRIATDLQEVRADLAERAERPLLRDLLLLHDSMLWFQRRLIDEQLDQDAIAEGFQYLVDELLEVLYRRDVVAAEAGAPGAPFDPAVHRAVGTVAAASPSDDGMIAEVRKAGFVRGDRLLRPAEVVVQRWRDEAV